ncbi:MAG: hypothetical protein LGR52_04990 [Candidatus Thiosymbion ectosymbiont of Robbea hypermnestra]|nr:hypothetical protein [Candidatus Thiosymbion ectosymbiont of Robbea hypermnestra]
MALDPTAARIADERLWQTYPELERRPPDLGPEAAEYRQIWRENYGEAVARKAPPPKRRPQPAPTPPPSAKAPSVVQQCPAAPDKKKVTDCKDMKNHVQEGDVVLRSTPGADSDLIRKAGRCDYSHAGIVSKNAKGKLVVVDAYPERTGGDVKEESIDDFFCEHDTFKGQVARPKNHKLGKKAADWAMEQTKDLDYKFDIFNPWNRDPKQLYCSDFVYQAYQNAGVELTPKKMDFLSPKNKENTLDALREYVKSKGSSTERLLVKLASDSKLGEELKKKAGGNSEYITPCQVAVNNHMDTVVDFDPSPPEKAKNSHDDGKLKMRGDEK